MSYYGAGTRRGPLRFDGTASPGVSAAATGRIYFDSATNKFLVSQNGGAYSPLVTAASIPVAPTGGTYTTASTGTRSIVAGDAANDAGFNDVSILGNGLVATANNQVLIGSSGFTAAFTVYLGNGVTNATPRGAFIQATGGPAASATTGAALTIRAGTGGSGGGSGGDTSIVGGAAGAGGAGGALSATGADSSTGAGGLALFAGGTGAGAAAGGVAILRGGIGGSTGAGASASVTGGAGGATSGAAGGASIAGGTPSDGNGGSVTVMGSSGVGTDRSGGSVTITAGDKTGTGTAGSVNVATVGGTMRFRVAKDGPLEGVGLASPDPAVAAADEGRLYYNSTDDVWRSSQSASLYGDVAVEITGTVTTTDNVDTTIQTLALADNTVYLLQVYYSARRTDAADRAIYVREACVYREAGGGATLQGAVSTTLTRESDGGWNALLTPSGNDVLVQVNGNAGQTVNWKTWSRLRAVA